MGKRPKRRRVRIRKQSAYPTHRTQQHLPYPELVESEPNDTPYRILDSNHIDGLISNGLTNKQDRQLIVPLDQNGHVVSNHELAHVKWSPEIWPKVRYHPNIFLAVEDARVNLGLERIGMPMQVPPSDRVEIAKLAFQDFQRGDYGMLILRGIASLGTDVEEAIFEPLAQADPIIRELGNDLRESVRTRLERAADRIEKPVASDRATGKIAKDVAKRLESYGLIEKCGLTSVAEADGCLVCGPPGEGCGDGDGVLTIDDGARAHTRRERSGGDVDPGTMKIVMAPTPQRILGNQRALERKWRPAAEGSVVTAVHRMPIDGAIFRRPIRHRGGTILIDTSGSMRLSSEEIDRLVRVAGGATMVAMYSGDGDEGELRIIAKDGRRAVGMHLDPYGQGNIVDLPALEWLAEQAMPRIWVSDGSVSGCGDRGSKELRLACADVKRRGQIERLGKVDDAIARMSRRGRRAARVDRTKKKS